MPPLLEVRDLTVCLEDKRELVRQVSFCLEKGKVFCLVGESGCGKSMTALSLLGLQPEAACISSGSLLLEGRELRGLGEKELCRIRGRRMAMIFQEPMTSLNPVLRIGDQVAEPLLRHLNMPRKAARQKALELLQRVGIPAAESRLDDYPHQLSGGMRQRVMIAMALACEPSLLLADEPTTALDVTIQGQILRLLKDLAKGGMGLLLITHDLGVVAEMADEVGVMYAGDLVERAPVHDFFAQALHPYAMGLMECSPSPDSGSRLRTIPGMVPQIRPQGCAFAARCPKAHERCTQEAPLAHPAPHREVRCWLYS